MAPQGRAVYDRNFDIVSGPLLTQFSARCHPARPVLNALVGARAYRMLICACNLMLCPIHVFRPVPVPPGRLNDSTPAVHRIWVQPRLLRARRCSHHRKREPGSAEPKLRPHVPAAAARGRRARSDGGLLARARLSVCRRGVRQLQRYFGPLLTSFQALSTPKRVFTRPPHASWNILYVATHTDTDWVLIWC